MFEFTISSQCSNTAARTGIFHTPNGEVNTPKFMPVGTLATVKGISSKQLTSTGSEMILSNTFHLHLQPGEKLVKESGGIHNFMNWNKPILTDSGGYQVFSLAKLNNISDRGVGKTQSNISNPLAIAKEISLREPIPIKYLGLFVGRNFGT